MKSVKRYKPLYKIFLRINQNIQNRTKLFKFKNQKWKQFKKNIINQLKFNKKFKIKDQFQLSTVKFASKGNSLRKEFKNNLIKRKLFSFFYGNLSKKYLKKSIFSILNSKNLKSLKLVNFQYNVLKFFESKLSTALYRSNFSFSIKKASQLIFHGHVKVNHQLVNIKSYTLKTNDFIYIALNLKSRFLVKNNIKISNFWPLPPKFLLINFKTLEILFVYSKVLNTIPIFDHYLYINSFINNIKKLVTMNNIKNKFYFKYLNTTHQFHLVDPSPWPLLASIGSFCLTSGTVIYMQKIHGGINLIINSLLLIFLIMFVWWRDIIRESTYEECHSITVQKGLRLGIILFIVSEIMLFFAFFWAFFHSSLAPTFNIGGVWPPKSIFSINTFSVPLTNTIILLSSGVTVTCAHHAIILGSKRHFLISLFCTLFLSILFTYFQGLEYIFANFNISDGIYGSCFYLATGFHGFHVLVGTIALFISFVRIVFNQQTTTHHLGFESAIWYWHFVDVVWLFLFVNIYWWGNFTIFSESILI